jgi:ribosome recycling factor
MPEQNTPLTNREVHLMFENIKDMVKAVREDIKQNNGYAEKRFSLIEGDMQKIKADVEELKTFKTRTLAYWTVGVTAVSIAVNKFL